MAEVSCCPGVAIVKGVTLRVCREQGSAVGVGSQSGSLQEPEGGTGTLVEGVVFSRCGLLGSRHQARVEVSSEEGRIGERMAVDSVVGYDLDVC